jgi:UrcA family protein
MLKGDVMVNFKSGLAAVVAAVGLGLAGVAGAQTNDQVPKLVLHYSPVSLSTEGGVRRLYGQLVSAAEQVCAAPLVGHFPSHAELACRRQAVADAVAQIHNSRLAELSAGRSQKG